MSPARSTHIHIRINPGPAAAAARPPPVRCAVPLRPMGTDAAPADNVGFALGVTLAAGLCTSFGALVPLCVRARRHAQRQIVACMLAGAAGVMTYISLVDLSPKAVDLFLVAFDDDHLLAEVAALAGFFAGFVVCVLLHFCVKRCTCGRPEDSGNVELEVNLLALADGDSDDEEEGAAAAAGEGPPPTATLCDTGVEREAPAAAGGGDVTVSSTTAAMTTLVVALHNVPEGITAFAGALVDRAFGMQLGLAIAIQNVPEGAAVAIPVYLTTQSLWRAAFFATLSGLMQPLGALLAWLVFGTLFSEALFGVLFAITSGMMVYISFTELVPNAFRTDPSTSVVGASILGGMGIMATTIALMKPLEGG